MLASLLGALIGGAFALVGGWYSIKWQKERETRGVAGALAAELATGQRLAKEGRVEELYQALLDGWKKTGEVTDRQFLVDLFGSQPQDALPIYYSMSGKLGLLPPQVGSDVVEYHSLVVGLQRTIVQFLGKREGISKQAVKGLANSIEAQWKRAKELRVSLISELEGISNAGATVNKRKGFIRLGIALATPYFAFWGITGLLSDSRVPEYVDLSRNAMDRGDWNTASMWMKLSNESNAWVIKSLTWGLAMPIAALIVLAISYWVYRGFKAHGQ